MCKFKHAAAMPHQTCAGLLRTVLMLLCADKGNGHNDNNSQPGSARKAACLPTGHVAVSNSVRSSVSASPLSPAVPPVADLVRKCSCSTLLPHHCVPMLNEAAYACPLPHISASLLTQQVSAGVRLPSHISAFGENSSDEQLDSLPDEVLEENHAGTSAVACTTW